MSAAPSSPPLLAATAIEETWAPPGTGSPIVFLASWCLRFGRRAAWEGLPRTVVGDPWGGETALREGVAKLRALTDRALEALAVALGAAHDERWTPREARLLLGPWLLAYLPAQLDRWQRLSLAVANHPGLVAWGTPAERAVTPADTLEAVQWLKGDRYNLQLMTPVMEALGIEVRPLEPIAGMPLEPAPGASGPSRLLADAVARLALAARGGRAVALRAAHFPAAVQFALLRGSRLAIVPAPGAGPTPREAADAVARARLPPLDLGCEPFERHLAAALAHDLPTCFLEGYPRLRAAAMRIGRYPRAVLSANAWHYNEPFKRWAADAAAAGTALLGVQHGGNYGIDAYAPSEDHETAVTDVFYTWGWTRNGVRARTVPMPAPKLIGRPKPGAGHARSGILFVTTSMPIFPMQIECGPERFERYLERQRRFLMALPERLIGALRVRPHRESMGWEISERIAAARKGAALESWEVRFEASLARCQLFVCDHLSTTFAEALAADHPTVLFWDPADTPVREPARAALDALRAAGVLLDDPESAARVVAAVYADVEAWWREQARARAVACFRTAYARTAEDAVAQWTFELGRFARGGSRRQRAGDAARREAVPAAVRDGMEGPLGRLAAPGARSDEVE